MIKVVTFWEGEKETKEMYPVNSTQISILCDMTIWLSETINCFFFFLQYHFFFKTDLPFIPWNLGIILHDNVWIHD